MYAIEPNRGAKGAREGALDEARTRKPVFWTHRHLSGFLLKQGQVPHVCPAGRRGNYICRFNLTAMKRRGRKLKQRRAAQLIEEALLLSVALVALSLLVGGIESILKASSGYTSSIWSQISSAISNMFSSLFHW
jgi:hypothetical protein